MKLSDYMSLRGLTDEALAKSVGVDRSAVTKWRRETMRPDWPSLAKLAEVTKGAVTPNDFLPSSGDADTPSDEGRAA
jgi:transcriptional regulator with XRE-family HTH domain